MPPVWVADDVVAAGAAVMGGLVGGMESPPVIAALRGGNLAVGALGLVGGEGVGAGHGEIPVASTGMTDLFCAGVTGLLGAGVADLLGCGWREEGNGGIPSRHCRALRRQSRGAGTGVGGWGRGWCWSRRDTRGKHGYDGSFLRGCGGTFGRGCGGSFGARVWREGGNDGILSRHCRAPPRQSRGAGAGVGGWGGGWCWSRRDTRGKHGYDGSILRGYDGTLGRGCGGKGGMTESPPSLPRFAAAISRWGQWGWWVGRGLVLVTARYPWQARV